MTAETSSANPTQPAGEPELIDLEEPAGGIPPVLTTESQLRRAVDAFAAARGPVAVDAERASGYRYGQHNFLVQLRREGAGTVLIDPIELPDLSAFNDAIGDDEWVFHAASQDLHPLREQGLEPRRIFDTELAARLLGMARVGLGAVVADILGLRLAKEHSAADWSKRPLPESWLRYATLDVEVLVELRDRLTERLADAGKLEWAHQEFAAVLAAPPPSPRVDPWRRTSHITDLRTRRALAIARELWQERDDVAQRRDVSPGRVLPDRAIIKAAQVLPRSVPDLLALREFAGRSVQNRATQWLAAIQRALALREDELPSMRGPASDGPPAPRSWAERAPRAAARLEAARPAVIARAEELNLPVENLLQPDTLRRLCWDESIGGDRVAEFLAGRGARPWQIEQAGPIIAQKVDEADHASDERAI
ncbi:HRDC domain-containing protein [Rarobacter faecitabidus]|uniref:Ribonuclease D n=1 Tax=Rarobacter faecitabidus TaxID=13243 RepID=A0A542ZW19_RARFA|nr:HRDC domain-containing protein [Rarobacter faecitabidus]TQL64558.1 ribonuclease D [Rarobacter faecitabidus]